MLIEMQSASLSSSQMVYEKVAGMKSGNSWSSVASSQGLGEVVGAQAAEMLKVGVRGGRNAMRMWYERNEA